MTTRERVSRLLLDPNDPKHANSVHCIEEYNAGIRNALAVLDGDQAAMEATGPTSVELALSAMEPEAKIATDPRPASRTLPRMTWSFQLDVDEGTEGEHNLLEGDDAHVALAALGQLTARVQAFLAREQHALLSGHGLQGQGGVISGYIPTAGAKERGSL